MNKTEQELVEKWEKNGFLDECENKLLLANNFENMEKFLVDGDIVEITEKEMDYESGVFETNIFPIIRRITEDVQITLEPMELQDHVFKIKYNNVKKYISDDYIKDEIEKLLKTKTLFSVFHKSNQKSKIDTEAVVSNLISNYLINMFR